MAEPDHKLALELGRQLDEYRLLRVLGAGGFGVTYLAEHVKAGNKVAVKEYLPNEIAVREGTTVHPKSSLDREGFEWGLAAVPGRGADAGALPAPQRGAGAALLRGEQHRLHRHGLRGGASRSTACSSATAL